VTDDGLHEALDVVARVPRLLVACDVDGTIAAIAGRPEDAVVDPGALTALFALAALPGTDVALVSGRRLGDLRAMADAGGTFVLVGSHGAEHDAHVSLDPVAARLLDDVLRDVHAIADGVPGVLLEEKAAGVAVHVRQAARDDAVRVLGAVEAGPARRPGVRSMHGKEVVELGVVDTDKGRALARLRADLSSDAVVYAGDDVTDESAFARLEPGDVGIKVGTGPTGAQFRIADTDDAVQVLHRLAASRRAAFPGAP
jgi:trehalose 6-phosphate phosphatase